MDKLVRRLLVMLCIISSNNRLLVRRSAAFSPNIVSKVTQRKVAISTSTTNLGSYLDNLNGAQTEAVTLPLSGITRVVAGPGAGKTRVLTCRIAHLLREDETSKILAVTFTKKAASEMQERLESLLEDSESEGKPTINDAQSEQLILQGNVEVPNGLDRVTLGTFHSICSKILRWNGKILADLPSVQEQMMGNPSGINLDGSFVILDQGDQLRIIKEQLKAKGFELEKDTKPLTVLNYMGRIKTKDFDEKELRRNKALRIARQVFPLYREHLFTTNALDFDDLIYLSRELLMERPEVRDGIRSRWSHILVDEFQDTSKAQLDLVKLWTSNSLLIVGDADQSIYSWRGAHVESMKDFGQDFTNVHTVYLMENYRSTSNIVRAAQKVIESSTGSASELRQNMKPMRGSGSAPRIMACANGKAEATYVVKTILGMIENEEMRKDQTAAVLYRTNAQSRAVEEACVEHNLPYVLRGSASTFYNRAEIKDCLCFLRWIFNGRDQSAMLRAFKTPSRGIGQKAIDEFQAYCGELDDIYTEQGLQDRPTPLDLLIALADDSLETIPEAPSASERISTRAINRFKPFAQQMRFIRDNAYQLPISNLTSVIVETLNLQEHFDAISKSAAEFADRWNNVQELRQAAERYTSSGTALRRQTDRGELSIEDSPLANFLDDVALVTDMASNDDDGSEKKIKANLMTVHGSKGMEFDIVFVIGNEDGTFPTSQAISEGSDSVALDEERRLCYVAMTRAKNTLILTWRKEVSFFQGDDFRTQTRDRSQFLNVLAQKGAKTGERSARMTERWDVDTIRSWGAASSSYKSGSKPGRFSPDGSRGVSIARRRGDVASRRFPKETPRGARRHVSSSHPATLKRADHMETPGVTHKKKKKKKVKKVRKVGGSLGPVVDATAYVVAPKKRLSQTQTVVTAPKKRTPQEQPKSAETGSDKMDSTWIYPIGSSVVHLDLGEGKILPPPPNKDGEMMVRVRFESSGKEMDLPAMGCNLFPN